MSGSIQVTITDRGEGFDYKSHLDLDSKRVASLPGRGIALVRLLYDTAFEYQGCGSRVAVTLPALREPDSTQREREREAANISVASPSDASSRCRISPASPSVSV